MTNYSAKTLVARFLLLIASAGFASAQLTTTAVENPPNYDTFMPPPAGGSYVDPVFGSTIQRVTNAMSMTNADGGGNLTWIENEYSTMSPFNGDNSRFILVHQSYFGLYNGVTGTYMQNLPLEINSSSEPRWSRADNVTLYYHYGNQLKTYNISSGAMNVVHTFSEYTAISGMGESDISYDGNHFVFAGNNRYIFVYEISTDKKYPVFDTGGTPFDSVYISPNNNVIISWLSTGTARYTGMELFDINMTFRRQIAHADGHKDVTLDTNGDELVVWTNSNDAQPIPNCSNGIVKIRLADAVQTCMLQLDWSLAVHISAPDKAGFAYIETYAPANPAPSTGGWVPYTNELIQVKLDGSQALRIAHHRSRPWNSYNWQPKISTSRDGSRFVSNSDYNLQGILSDPTEYNDVYLTVVNLTPPPPSAPPAPVLNSATAVSSAEIDLAWTNPTSSTATGNKVLRCTGSACAPSTVVAFLSATAASYHDTSVAPSTTYTYLIQASNATGSSNSNALGATTPAPPLSAPPAPVLNSAAAVSSTEIDLAWTNPGGSTATGNKVLRCTGSACTPSTVVASLSATTAGYHDTSVAPSTTYTYLIQASNASGSSNSNLLSGATPAAPPTGPARYEQENPALQYTGSWFTKYYGWASGGSIVTAMDQGSQAKLTFTGTGVKWIGYNDQWSGTASVYVDGAFKGTVDTYSKNAQSQVVNYSIGSLSNSTHTIAIYVNGAHSKRSSGSWVWVDAFDVTR